MRSSCIAITLTATTALSGVGMTAPASASCTVTYINENPGDPPTPRWSDDCDTTVAPGRFGPLRMGATTVSHAKRLNYLARNPFCGGAVYGLNAGPNWKKKGDRLVAWLTGYRKHDTRTTRGLRPRDPFTKARRLYPGLKHSRYVPGQFGGPGQNVYSAHGGLGWLDVYVTRGHARIDYFSVRADSVAKPVPWIVEGC